MKKVAIVVGHNEKKQGSYSEYLKMTEFKYNFLLANYIAGLSDNKIQYKVFYRDPNKPGYNTEMRDLVDRLHQEKFDLVLELHYNGWITETAEGSTGIVYYKNDDTINLLTKIQKQLYMYYRTKIRPIIKVRGYNGNIDDKTVADPKKTNGSYGVVNCRYSYILLEPFFGSNKNECNKYISYKQVGDILDKTIKEHMNV